MSAPDRGRHRAGRHAAPKPVKVMPKRIGAVFSVASVGSVAMTGASSLGSGSNSANTIYAEPTIQDLSSVAINLTPITDEKTANLRAKAASRSDSRTTTEDVDNINGAANVADPVADPTIVIDTTPTLTADERRALAAVSSSTNQIDDIVAQAQVQAEVQAQNLLLQQTAVKEATSKNGSAAAIAAAASQVRSLGSRQVPIAGSYRLTARFGQHGRLWSKGWHTGLDFQIRSGTTVVAAEGGTIIKAGWAGAYGYRIEIRHADGYVTTYNHLSKIEKESGSVSAGQEIGKSGNTGNTTGAHLHFEVELDGNLVNPSTWLWGSNR